MCFRSSDVRKLRVHRQLTRLSQHSNDFKPECTPVTHRRRFPVIILHGCSGAFRQGTCIKLNMICSTCSMARRRSSLWKCSKPVNARKTKESCHLCHRHIMSAVYPTSLNAITADRPRSAIEVAYIQLTGQCSSIRTSPTLLPRAGTSRCPLQPCRRSLLVRSCPRSCHLCCRHSDYRHLCHRSDW
jgi:hypothetical protein